MPIRPPVLDDRRFDDLVQEVLERIPAHTPEWKHTAVGDPGRTLIDLFAWLTDALLYRVNLVPERQRLAFLRLLGERMRPARAARGIAALQLVTEAAAEPVLVPAESELEGPAVFEAVREVTVHGVSGAAYVKRALSQVERAGLSPVLSGLAEVYGLPGLAEPYQTTPLFADGRAEPGGVDLVRDTVDGVLWIALLAPKASDPTVQESTTTRARELLARGPSGGRGVLNLGLVPLEESIDPLEPVGEQDPVPRRFEYLRRLAPGADPEYGELEVQPGGDTTAGLRRRGVVQLVLPPVGALPVIEDDVARILEVGVGDRPPRLDDPELAARLAAWIRMRPLGRPPALRLAWAGVHAVEIHQRSTSSAVVVGHSSGAPGQRFALPGTSVEQESFALEVEEPGAGYRTWTRVDDLALAGRDDAVYSLDSEAGAIEFGDGMRGRVPRPTARIRVARARFGGGAAGNLPAGTLQTIRGDSRLSVAQPIATTGGVDAESLADAERRIPARLRHRERAVTADDYRALAAETPGVRLGRVDVLPRFKPQQRRPDVPGCVSLLLLPAKRERRPPAPRPDRPLLLAVDEWLRPRRPLGTEMYVMGCEYVPIGLSTAVAIDADADRESTLQAIQDALHDYLWPLAPYGPDGEGWPLGRAVRDRELEVVVARVAGVAQVGGVELFERSAAGWVPRPRAGACAAVEMPLEAYQLPELLAVVAVEGAAPPADLAAPLEPLRGGTAVPVIPEVCR